MLDKLTASEARQNFSDILNRAAFGRERVIIHRGKKAVAAIIPGPRNAAEFNANLELLRHPIPPALWADLRQAGLLHPEAPVPRPPPDRHAAA